MGPEEVVDCDILDGEEGIELEALETIEGGKPKPVLVLVVVGMAGCGVVREVVVGNKKGTVGQLTLTMDFWEDRYRGRTRNHLPSYGRTSHGT